MASPASVPQAEVVIGGAGFAGLALAIALRQGLGNAFGVTVIDPALAHAQSKDPRACSKRLTSGMPSQPTRNRSSTWS